MRLSDLHEAYRVRLPEDRRDCWYELDRRRMTIPALVARMFQQDQNTDLQDNDEFGDYEISMQIYNPYMGCPPGDDVGTSFTMTFANVQDQVIYKGIGWAASGWTADYLRNITAPNIGRPLSARIVTGILELGIRHIKEYFQANPLIGDAEPDDGATQVTGI